MRLAIDIGGTFTDSVLVDQNNSIVASTKTLTSHKDPSLAAFDGASDVLASAGVGLDAVTLLIHGTTLATNALIEKRGAKVATISTRGFRDILEIAYERRYSQYDINLQKPDFLVPRSRSFTITERMSVHGDILVPLQESELSSLANSIKKLKVESVAVCLIHAYANDSHEKTIAEYLHHACPDVAVSLSSEVSPEAREFDRLCTTVANAYVKPLMAEYLGSFAERFHSQGFVSPILMMTAGGGMTTLETAARYPIRLVESGPAGGAVLAAETARQSGLSKVLSFDMGGTTAKLCLIDDAQPQTARQFEIARAARFIKGSGMPVRIPVVEMIEIGAGGGSIATVDRVGRLQVGPQSAGSEPGPAAFAKGGDMPTVTDADVLLGYIVPERFAGGRFKLDIERARAAVDSQISKRLSLGKFETAEGISRIVDENMANAARMHAVESGKHLGERTMIAFGGNGPLHACRVARASGIKKILIPHAPGVGSAVGFLFAPISFEVVRSHYCWLDSLDASGLTKINDLLKSMQTHASSIVEMGCTDAKPRSLAVRKSAFMRYHGQGYEIEIDLPDRNILQEDIENITGQFEHEYAKLFSRPVPGMRIEILNWSVHVSAFGSDLKKDTAGDITVAPSTEVDNTRADKTCEIWCDVTGAKRQAKLLWRESMVKNVVVEGPALICEHQTTTLVAADFRSYADELGNIVVEQIN